MEDIITMNEIFNDGKTVHLYFNDMTGFYVAYGISAYLLYKYSKTILSYSNDMQMPVAMINAEHYEEVTKQFKLLNNVDNYRCMTANEKIDMNEYKEWASQLRIGANS